MHGDNFTVGTAAAIEDDISQDLPLYNITVTFRTCQNTLRPPPYLKFRAYENTYLLHMDNSHQLILSRESQRESDQLLVGCLHDSKLNVDIVRIMGHMSQVRDWRYFIHGLYCVHFEPCDDEEFCFKLNMNKSNSFSVYPPEYTFDISFWLSNDYNLDNFLKIIRNVSNGLVRTVTLIDTYMHPETQAPSHCYRIIYQSLDCALSYSQAYQYFQHLRIQCQELLNVILR